jgi:hypothetical protein
VSAEWRARQKMQDTGFMIHLCPFDFAQGYGGQVQNGFLFLSWIVDLAFGGKFHEELPAKYAKERERSLPV